MRALIAALAHIKATARGFLLKPRDACDVVVLAPPIAGFTTVLLLPAALPLGSIGHVAPIRGAPQGEDDDPQRK